MPCFNSLFAVFSDSEKMCSGAYSSFLLIPRHLTPTVYTSSETSAIDIFTFGLGGCPDGGGDCGTLCEACFWEPGERTRLSAPRAFLNSDLRSTARSALCPSIDRRTQDAHLE